MSRLLKWFIGIATTIIALALLALAGMWYLGLLPLLLPEPVMPDVSLLYDDNMAAQLDTATQQLGTATQQLDTATQQPGASAGGAAQGGQAGQGGQAADKPGGAGNAAGGQQISNTQSGKARLRQEIEGSYISRLKILGESYRGKLDTLVSQAYAEYQMDKNRGGDGQVIALARKYLKLGKDLENQCHAVLRGADGVQERPEEQRPAGGHRHPGAEGLRIHQGQPQEGDPGGGRQVELNRMCSPL